MGLTTGTRLGPYEVTAPLGAGGMGEVYRAHDTRLRRDVALKVLPADVARDADRRARFEREARAVAALSHPNILAIHDIGAEGDTLFVVTELLDGETLADRLRHGALPLRKAVEIAIGVARGLSAAHGKGIAHRDLKPANIFLLGDGQVKILDFGLAREIASDAGATHTHAALTDPGTVLGTAGYMAPEQVRGQPVDGRADLFALGVVLYEMLTGTRAFARETTIETLNAILKEDPPDLTTARADLPPALDRIVRHALEKNPAERFQSARDVIFALDALTGTGSGLRPVVGPEPTRRARRAAVWGAAGVALMLTGAVGGARLWGPGGPALRQPMFVAVGAPFNRFHVHAAPALSPDGNLVAFWAPDASGVVQLWLKDLREPDVRPVPGTIVSNLGLEGYQPTFSPDGRSLLVFLDNKLKRVLFDGSSPQTLAEAPEPRGASWGSRDQIVYQPNVGGPLHAIAPSGGAPRVLPDARPMGDLRSSARHPHFLPDGTHFLFNDLSRIYVASIDGGSPTLLLEAASRAEYAGGYLWFVKGTDLMAQRFDLESLSLVGDAVRVAERVGANGTSHVDKAFSVTAAGTLAVWENSQSSLAELVWLDRAGRRQGIVGEPWRIDGFTASSGLEHVAAEVSDEQSDGASKVRVIDVGRGTSIRVTLDTVDRVYAATPIISRDGRRVFAAGQPDIFQIELPGQAPTLLANRPVVWLTDVSRDGQWLLFTANDVAGGSDLWALPLSRPGAAPEPYLATRDLNYFGRFSPDGRWVAFVQDEGGKKDVYADAFPGKDRRLRVSPKGGALPMWSDDGKRLYYLTSDNRMMEVSVTTSGDGLRFSSPVELFQAPVPNGVDTRPQFWPSPDGQRFLFNARLESALPRTIRVILNWPELLEE